MELKMSDHATCGCSLGSCRSAATHCPWSYCVSLACVASGLAGTVQFTMPFQRADHRPLLHQGQVIREVASFAKGTWLTLNSAWILNPAAQACLAKEDERDALFSDFQSKVLDDSCEWKK